MRKLISFVVLCACLGIAFALKAEEVPGVTKNADGYWAFEHEGEQWLVVDAPDEEMNRPYYFNVKTAEAVWNDPRIKLAGNAYDPYADAIPAVDPSVAKPPASATPIIVATMVPVCLFIVGMVARIWYLQTYYPELLWPTKDRKYRQRASGNGRFKPQKARGKMSQDGKGGRSANS